MKSSCPAVHPMERKKTTLRSLSGILKDRASLAKASLYSKTRSNVHSTIIRATTHGATAAPKEYCLDALLSLGVRSHITAAMCIGALMDRLHKTRNAFVALKCLFAVHNVISRGCLALKDELSVFPSRGGHNFLKLSGFRDGFDDETFEYSSWVRWYAEFLEQTMIAARVMGYFLSPFSSSTTGTLRRKREVRIRESRSSELYEEIDLLVDLVAVICSCPESVHLQSHDLVYEIVSLVLEDYRAIRHGIQSRLIELERRTPESPAGTAETVARMLSALNKLEGCREKLFVLFVNKANNDGLWELIPRMKRKLIHHLTRPTEAPMISWRAENIYLPCYARNIRDSTYAVAAV
ncbi:hypothetical protein SAY86_023783 [Trapa natans]|uniref:ENTH domain-containing protein n=1 Tax=Trapa natans TaxID=22666 RepID=A0AAN7LQH9_TRANT|nr:hypothetical protein SAY86_023783 [Trapa natans]